MTSAPRPEAPSAFLRGGIFALLAAVAFGVTTPLVQRFGAHAGPFVTAALLYFGAAMASALPLPGVRPAGAPMRAQHLPRLVLVAIAGALVAPVCLAWGVQRMSAVGASLLLNLEGVFTVLLAAAFYGEHVGPRVRWALLFTGGGGAILVFTRGGSGGADGSVLGALAVAGATLAWATDNALTRPLAELEPSRVVLGKGLLGATFASALAAVFGETMPGTRAVLGLLACGATGYGASLIFYLAAQRRLGAARTASIFAAAPFVGAAVAFGMGGTSSPLPTVAAALLCLAGVWLHLTEHHAHEHTHGSLLHEHPHRHDDGHHAHIHDAPVAGEHSHPHRHDAVTHTHDHAPDLHHGHDHE